MEGKLPGLGGALNTANHEAPERKAFFGGFTGSFSKQLERCQTYSTAIKSTATKRP